MTAPEAVDNRRSIYCPTVGAFCPVSCGFFPFSIFAPPAATAPSILNPNFPSPTIGGGGGDFSGNGGNGANGGPSKKGKKGTSSGSKGSKKSGSSGKVNDRGNVTPAPSPPNTPQVAAAVVTSGSTIKNGVQSTMVTAISAIVTLVWWLV